MLLSASGYHRASGLLRASEGAGVPDAEGGAEALERSRRGYLDHANQCGFLLRSVRLGFLFSRRMQTTSVKMRILDLTLDQLRRFTGAGGGTLAALSTHEGGGGDGGAIPVYSGWTGFALEVVGFLGLGSAVDVDAIAARHLGVGGDTGFLPLGKWGAGGKAVLGRLVGRRPDIDAGDIRREFEAGLAGKLVIGGRPAIRVRF